MPPPSVKSPGITPRPTVDWFTWRGAELDPQEGHKAKTETLPMDCVQSTPQLCGEFTFRLPLATASKPEKANNPADKMGITMRAQAEAPHSHIGPTVSPAGSAIVKAKTPQTSQEAASRNTGRSSDPEKSNVSTIQVQAEPPHPPMEPAVPPVSSTEQPRVPQATNDVEQSGEPTRPSVSIIQTPVEAPQPPMETSTEQLKVPQASNNHTTRDLGQSSDLTRPITQRQAKKPNPIVVPKVSPWRPRAPASITLEQARKLYPLLLPNASLGQPSDPTRPSASITQDQAEKLFHVTLPKASLEQLSEQSKPSVPTKQEQAKKETANLPKASLEQSSDPVKPSVPTKQEPAKKTPALSLPKASLEQSSDPVKPSVLTKQKQAKKPPAPILPSDSATPSVTTKQDQAKKTHPLILPKASPTSCPAEKSQAAQVNSMNVLEKPVPPSSTTALGKLGREDISMTEAPVEAPRPTRIILRIPGRTGNQAQAPQAGSTTPMGKPNKEDTPMTEAPVEAPQPARARPLVPTTARVGRVSRPPVRTEEDISMTEAGMKTTQSNVGQLLLPISGHMEQAMATAGITRSSNPHERGDIEMVEAPAQPTPEPPVVPRTYGSEQQRVLQANAARTSTDLEKQDISMTEAPAQGPQPVVGEYISSFTAQGRESQGSAVVPLSNPEREDVSMTEAPVQASQVVTGQLITPYMPPQPKVLPVTTPQVTVQLTRPVVGPSTSISPPVVTHTLTPAGSVIWQPGKDRLGQDYYPQVFIPAEGTELHTPDRECPTGYGYPWDPDESQRRHQIMTQLNYLTWRLQQLVGRAEAGGTQLRKSLDFALEFHIPFRVWKVLWYAMYGPPVPATSFPMLGPDRKLKLQAPELLLHAVDLLRRKVVLTTKGLPWVKLLKEDEHVLLDMKTARNWVTASSKKKHEDTLKEEAAQAAKRRAAPNPAGGPSRVPPS